MTRRTHNCRQLLSGLRLLFLLLTTLGAAAQPKRVLVVHSFGSAAPPFTTTSTAFEMALTEEMGERVDLDEISLDVARYATLDMEEALVELMRKRQARWQPDLVVPMGSPAGVFVAQYRDRLFPATTPIIYSGMDQRRLPSGALRHNAAFVGASYDLLGAIEDILQMAPATTNVVIVIGATPLEHFWADVLRRDYAVFTNRLSFTWFNDLSFDQMLERSAKLPPHSFMLLILYMRDASGVTHNANDTLKRIHQVANAPINGLFTEQMGQGIVGGRIYSEELEGRESARVAVRILRGEPATNFPPKIVGAPGPQYDWRELRRWNISENRLPPGSLVKFRTPTTWELYRWPIIGTALFCVLQAALIVSLLINRARRRQGEREATLIADVSSKFVHLPPSEVDHEIQDAQRRVFELLDLDVSGFWQWSADASGFFRLTHYSRPGEDPQIPERLNSQEYFPWYQQQVLAGRTIAVRSMTELPPEAARDRETFRQFGFKSNLTIPLSVGGEPPIGALGFNTTREERDWPDVLIQRLQLVAQIFTNALARKRADQALRESEERMRMSQQAARVGMFDWNITTGVNVWTLELEAMHGLPPGGFAKTQPAWESLVHPDDRAAALQKVKLAFQTGQPATGEWRVIWPDGSVHWLVGRFQVFKDEAGKPLRMTGVNIDITERKQAEEGLRESEEMLRSIFASTPDSITVVDLDGRIKHCNQSTAHIHGFSSAEQLLGKNVAELVAEEDRPRIPEVTQQVMTHGVAKDVPFVGLKGSGGKFAGELSFSVLKDGSGRPIGFVGITRDVTERKRTEAALRASELKYRNVVEMTGTGYLIVDLQGRVMDANQEYVRISGHGELREIIGRSVIEWTAERAKQQNAKAVAQCARDGLIRNFVTEYTGASGKPTFVEVNANVEGEGESARIVSLCRDITERKRVEDALQESEARFRIVADTAPVLIWMAGPDKLCNFFNKGWLEFTGRTLEQELGNGWAEGVHREDLNRCLEVYTNSFDTRQDFAMEYRLRRRNGEYGWVLDIGIPRFATDGAFLGYIGSCIDITARKHSEQEIAEQRNQLAHLSRVTMLGELSGSLAHELNQPLTAILSNAQAAQRFLAHDHADLNEVRDILNDIVNEDKRAGEVIRRLRLLLEKGEVQRQPLDVNAAVQEILKLVRSDLVIHGVTAQAELAPGLPMIHADRVQFQQVLLNLVMNACDAMRGNVAADRQVIVRTEWAESAAVRVSVSDRGCGIPANRIERVFDPFFTTKAHGLGLGLSVCRTIIETHRGRIWAENNASGGATFRVTLPVAGGATES